MNMEDIMNLYKDGRDIQSERRNFFIAPEKVEVNQQLRPTNLWEEE